MPKPGTTINSLPSVSIVVGTPRAERREIVLMATSISRLELNRISVSVPKACNVISNDSTGFVFGWLLGCFLEALDNFLPASSHGADSFLDTGIGSPCYYCSDNSEDNGS